MLFEDTYKTIQSPVEGVFRDRGSKFIAYAYPVKSESVIKDIISVLRNEHPKARHFCWAIRLSPDRTVFRINDDGEPSGSAGRPILNALLSADITNILVVVVRYFGGTLLGVPGLINAYKTSTVEAIQAALIIDGFVADVYELQYAYLQMNDVMRIIKEEGLEILTQEFDSYCKIQISIRKSVLNKVLARLEKVEGLVELYLYTI